LVIKNFVKAIDQSGVGFTYLKYKFSRISDTKIKEGEFVGLRVRELITELIQNVKFEEWLSKVEKAAWKSFKNITTIFFWEIIQKKTVVIWSLIKYIQSYKAMGCNTRMSLKVHFLDSHSRLLPRKSRGSER
jgi:hypothetical protein